jgi:phage baseplate assembly protein W
MANNLYTNIIGIGPLFPIRITENEKGENHLFPKQHNNLSALLWYDIGQRFRQEDFGTRLWECIEEPNTQALAFLVKDFLKKAISTYETRITFKSLNMRLEGTKLFIEMNYVINQTGSQQVLGISYDRSENILKPY